VINYSEGELWDRELAGGQLDLVLDAVGEKDGFPRSKSVLRAEGGRFVSIVDATAGYDPLAHPPLAYAAFHCLSNNPAHQDALGELLSEGRLIVPIDEVFVFDDSGNQVRAILKKIEGGKSKGKNVLRVDPYAIHVLVSLTVSNDPATRESFIKTATELQQLTQEKDEGCVLYDIVQLLLQPSPSPASTEWMVLELWRSEEDLSAHSAADHYKTLLPQLATFATINYVIKGQDYGDVLLQPPPSPSLLPHSVLNKDLSVVRLAVTVMIKYNDEFNEGRFIRFASELSFLSRREKGCHLYSFSKVIGCCCCCVQVLFYFILF
jgi:quinol monooxygenase YgiN